MNIHIYEYTHLWIYISMNILSSTRSNKMHAPHRNHALPDTHTHTYVLTQTHTHPTHTHTHTYIHTHIHIHTHTHTYIPRRSQLWRHWAALRYRFQSLALSPLQCTAPDCLPLPPLRAGRHEERERARQSERGYYMIRGNGVGEGGGWTGERKIRGGNWDRWRILLMCAERHAENSLYAHIHPHEHTNKHALFAPPGHSSRDLTLEP